MSLAAGLHALLFSVLNPFAFVSVPVFLIGLVIAFRLRFTARVWQGSALYRLLCFLFAICPAWLFVFAGTGNEIELILSSAWQMAAGFIGAPFGLGWLLGWLGGYVAQASALSKSTDV